MYEHGIIDLGVPIASSHDQANVANSATNPLTIPDEADYARVWFKDNDVYFTVDGTTPTNTAGGGLGFFADISAGIGGTVEVFLNRYEMENFLAINAISAVVGEVQACYYTKKW